ncbi:MAG: hypothetical protein EXR71_12200 [Myxococcales bacterium]|nr:hypothetical protein [Myxococcales bacterium]
MTLLSLLACTSGAPVADGDTQPIADSGNSDDSGDGTPVDTDLELNGTWATNRAPAPDFVATNRDKSGRSRVDLIGHPTVVWFYPAAGTSG